MELIGLLAIILCLEAIRWGAIGLSISAIAWLLLKCNSI